MGTNAWSKRGVRDGGPVPHGNSRFVFQGGVKVILQEKQDIDDTDERTIRMCELQEFWWSQIHSCSEEG